jgi:hypothetical protein
MAILIVDSSSPAVLFSRSGWEREGVGVHDVLCWRFGVLERLDVLAVILAHVDFPMAVGVALVIRRFGKA